MKSADYWRGRFSLLEDAAHVRADQCVDGLEAIYRDAERSVQADLERWYGRFAANNNVSLFEARKMLTTGQLEEFKWNVDQYIKIGQQANLSPEWLKKLENASARFHISRLEAVQMQIQQQIELLYGNQVDSIDSLLKEIVSNGYTQTAYEIQKGLGLGWDITALDQKKLETLL
ncbi:phage head morphogenesis protein, partial [Oscillospiraceae bacterium 44-34]